METAERIVTKPFPIGVRVVVKTRWDVYAGEVGTVKGTPYLGWHDVVFPGDAQPHPYADFELLTCREDGWPLCPRCDEDELWSPLLWNGEGERPVLAAYLKAGLRCYRCNWSL